MHRHARLRLSIEVVDQPLRDAHDLLDVEAGGLRVRARMRADIQATRPVLDAAVLERAKVPNRDLRAIRDLLERAPG